MSPTKNEAILNEKHKEAIRRIEWLETHWSTFNDEMGAVKTAVEIIKNDMRDIKESLSSFKDAFKWGVGILLTVLLALLGILLQHLTT